MGTDEGRADVQGIYQDVMPDEERDRFDSLTSDLHTFGIYRRDISRWYHVTWGRTADWHILMFMGLLIVLFVMLGLIRLIEGDYVIFVFYILMMVASSVMLWYAHYMMHGNMFGYVRWFDMGMPDLVDPIHAVFTERGLDHVLYRALRPDKTLYFVLKLPDDGRRIILWEHKQTTIVHVANAGIRDDKATQKICGYIDEAAANA